MGLDVSHDAWHGAYSAFMRWRAKLAQVAGLPPLMLMEGFHDTPRVTAWATQAIERLDAPYDFAAACHNLPIKWSSLKPDPLHVLLNHSDCDGEIAPEHLPGIAARLEELAPLMLDEDGGGHVRIYREKTLQFARGARAAATAGEPLVFA